MRKRLRKKRRLGEFAEFGFEIAFTYQSGSEVAEDDLIDAFIEEAIEARSLCFGGGGGQGLVEGFATSERGSATEHDREAVQLWFEARSGVLSVTVGPLRDANHGWG